MFDVSVVTTFHDEGPLAQQSLNALARSVSVARASGLKVQVVAVLDKASAETRRIVASHSGIETFEVSNGDLAMSRNDGVATSKGAFVAIVDGDDYCSENWLSASHAFASTASGRGRVLRHEWVLNFGAVNDFSQQVSFDDPLFDVASLLVFNPYVSSCFAPREVFQKVPYRPSLNSSTGYGFEDWHWVCETIASGIGHVVVPGTAFFYRRKPGGMLARESAGRSILAPSSLFAPTSFVEARP